MHPLSIRVLAFAVSLIVAIIPALLFAGIGFVATGSERGALAGYLVATAAMSLRTAGDLAFYCEEKAIALPLASRTARVWATALGLLVAGVPGQLFGVILRPDGALALPVLIAGLAVWAVVFVSFRIRGPRA